MPPHPRYRTENGRSVIDIRVRTTRHLFDHRDPAPFRERDIDDDAMDYILGAIDELPRRAPLELAIWVAEPTPIDLSQAELTEALRAHFAWERDRFATRLRDHFRRAQVVTLLGLVVLGAFLSLAALVDVYVPAGPAQAALREGFLVIGWVAIWRPIEALLYDWWPLASQRARRVRLIEAPIVVKTGHPPEA